MRSLAARARARASNSSRMSTVAFTTIIVLRISPRSTPFVSRAGTAARLYCRTAFWCAARRDPADGRARLKSNAERLAGWWITGCTPPLLRTTWQPSWRHSRIRQRHPMFRPGLHPPRRYAPLPRLKVDLAPRRPASLAGPYRRQRREADRRLDDRTGPGRLDRLQRRGNVRARQRPPMLSGLRGLRQGRVDHFARRVDVDMSESLRRGEHAPDPTAQELSGRGLVAVDRPGYRSVSARLAVSLSIESASLRPNSYTHGTPTIKSWIGADRRGLARATKMAILRQSSL